MDPPSPLPSPPSAGGWAPVRERGVGSLPWRLASASLSRLSFHCEHAPSPPPSTACGAIRGAVLRNLSEASYQLVAGTNYRLLCDLSGGVTLRLALFLQLYTRTLSLETAQLSDADGGVVSLLTKAHMDLSGGAERYESITLRTAGLSASLFLPPLPSSHLHPFYVSSRFDWGSMLGDLTLHSSHGGGHVLMGAGEWRWPHDPSWPEAGVGLASEFGCGADGWLCDAGWGEYPAGSFNGVLGYGEARGGESFIKIGTRTICIVSTGEEEQWEREGGVRRGEVNPYRLASPPEWELEHANETAVTLRHAARVREWGYEMRRTVHISRGDGGEGGTLTMSTQLSNTGSRHFSTPFYSHNLYSIDSGPTCPPWAFKPDLSSPSRHTSAAWGASLEEYFTLSADGTFLCSGCLEEDVLMKATFANESDNVVSSLGGGFTLHYADVKISSELGGPSASSPLYAYSLYVESHTISPEPVRMISLSPGESSSWEQRITISSSSGHAEEPQQQQHAETGAWNTPIVLSLCALALMSVAVRWRRHCLKSWALRAVNKALASSEEPDTGEAPYMRLDSNKS
ncbi:MAG: hypothetical protein SGPRY_011959 [Prymnesium sp.]